MNRQFFLLQLDEPKLELGREYLVNGIDDKSVMAYYDFMVENAVIFGANRTRAEEEMKDALELEIKLANVSDCHPVVSFVAIQLIAFIFVCKPDFTTTRRTP